MSEAALPRLFLAVPIDDDVRAGLLAFLADHGSTEIPGRHVVSANWHITLRFLGETTSEQRDRLVGYLDDHVAGGPFVLRFGGLGAFPRPLRAAVAWLAIRDEDDRLGDIAGLCEEAAHSAGFSPEERPFHAHLTLSRIRPPAPMADIVDTFPPFPGKLAVDRIVLYESVLGQGPVQYRVVDEFAL